MAKEALIHLGFFHVCDAHRDHFEMHHVMTRRSLMTLRTRLGDGGRVAEFRERPFRGAVALRAVRTEQATVPVFGLVAGRAIEQ